MPTLTNTMFTENFNLLNLQITITFCTADLKAVHIKTYLLRKALIQEDKCFKGNLNRLEVSWIPWFLYLSLKTGLAFCDFPRAHCRMPYISDNLTRKETVPEESSQ